MKKRKWLTLALAAVMVMTLLPACGGGHVHSYTQGWSSDADNHWHSATCDDTSEVSGLAKHTFGEWTKGDTPTCLLDADNVRACTVCGYAQTIAPTAHNVTKTDEVPASCKATGTEAYWSCDICDKLYSDEAGETEISAPVTVPETEHTPVLVHTPATCKAVGIEDHYKCGICDKLFSDEEGKNEISISDLQTYPKLTTHDVKAVEIDADDKKTVILPNSTTEITFPKMAYYQCGVCQKSFWDKAYTKDLLEPVYCNMSTSGYLLEGDSVSGLIRPPSVTYQADVNNVYIFAFSGINTIATINYYTDSTKQLVYNKAWKTDVAAYAQFQETSATPANNMVIVEMKQGEVITIQFTGTTGMLFTATKKVKAVGDLTYGENTVAVSVANSALDIDVYAFVSEETKAYSLTVPAGVSVVKDGENFLTGNATSETYKNFEATAGTPIQFCFVSATIGEYTVNIGEAIYPIITPDSPQKSFTVDVKAVGLLRVGAVEEGKYTVSVTVPRNFMSGGMVFFAKCADAAKVGDYRAFTGTDEYGNFKTGDAYTGQADMYFQFPNKIKLNENDYELGGSGTIFTVTLTLKEGDLLVFAHTALTNGALSVTMAKA